MAIKNNPLGTSAKTPGMVNKLRGVKETIAMSKKTSPPAYQIQPVKTATTPTTGMVNKLRGVKETISMSRKSAMPIKQTATPTTQNMQNRVNMAKASMPSTMAKQAPSAVDMMKKNYDNAMKSSGRKKY